MTQGHYIIINRATLPCWRGGCGIEYIPSSSNIAIRIVFPISVSAKEEGLASTSAIHRLTVDTIQVVEGNISNRRTQTSDIRKNIIITAELVLDLDLNVKL